MTAALPAELTLASIAGVLPRIDGLVQSGAVDLSGVTRADSAGIALLLEMTRRARRGGGALTLRGASEQIRGLIRFFELESALDLE